MQQTISSRSKLRIRFRLRSLLLLLLISAVPLSWWVNAARRQRLAVRAVTTTGFYYDVSYSYGPHGYVTDYNAKSPTLAWLGNVIGDDFVYPVHTMLLRSSDVSGDRLEPLTRLRGLEFLSLGETQGTDEALRHLSGLNSLTHLELYNTNVTDDGLEHLKGLTNLKYLDLRGTQVTDAGVKKLRSLVQLIQLDLRSTHVTDAVIEHLTALKNLERLDIFDTNITADGGGTLQLALPNCNSTPPNWLLDPALKKDTTEQDTNLPSAYAVPRIDISPQIRHASTRCPPCLISMVRERSHGCFD